MATVKIERKLADISKKIEDLVTPEIRAMALFDHLKSEQGKIDENELVSSSRHGINRTLEIMENLEYSEELNLAIQHVQDYLEKGIFGVNKACAKRSNFCRELKFRLSNIINDVKK